MTKKIDFVGLATQSGQELNGSMLAPESYLHFLKVINYHSQSFVDHGTIKSHWKTVQKLNSRDALGKFDFDFYSEAFFRLLKIYEQQNLILNWGGDHSVALSTVSAFTYHYSNGYVLWIDAHADLNLPDASITKNLHGMPASFLLNLQGISNSGLFWMKNYLDPQRLIYVGLRDLDPFEVETLEKLKIKFYTSQDVKRLGMSKVSQEISATVGVNPLHVSFDIDSLDPLHAPSTGLNVHEGLSLSDVIFLGNSLKSKNLKSVDVVEINPCIGSLQDVHTTNLSAHLFIESLRSNQTVWSIPNHEWLQGGNDAQFYRTDQKYHSTQMESRSSV